MAKAKKENNNNQNTVHNLKKSQKESTNNVTDEWSKIKEDSIASIVGLVASYEKTRKNASSMEYERNKTLDKTAKDPEKIEDVSKGLLELQKQNGEKDATITALRIEIDHLKNKGNDKIPATAKSYKEITTENDQLKGKVTELMTMVADLEKERTKLKKEIFDLNDDVINSLVAERDEQVEMKFKYMDQLKECQRRIKELEEERESRKSELKMHNDASNCGGEAVVSTDERIETRSATLNTNNDESTTNASDLPSPASSLDSGVGMDIFTNHIASFKIDMERKIENMIEEKLNLKHRLMSTSESFEKPMSSSQISQIIPEQYARDFEREREKNVIIHGLEEDEGTDEEKLNEIFRTTNSIYNPTSMFRLGTKSTNKIRPIMLRMKTISDKEEFMSKLWMLKHAKMQYRKLSITHDYTQEERMVI